ncbi:McrC family protein [Vibrio sinaloensis]|uniref:McrC family protein n=1 Tax=Photobacterium sp. (strain ATCC 43367) TaxID=379097 RepID=UPI0022AF6651|nr:McrC family protein [Vibrio sinaloensis]MCZ4295033.1 McrC family protein [Vibrio sinaloensis]
MQSSNRAVCLFEYDFLSSDSGALVESKVRYVSDSCYQYLKRLCLSDSKERQLLRLRRYKGMEVLQVQNYAGVIMAPDGTQIEILPKVGRHSELAEKDAQLESRSTLLVMLKTLRTFRHIQTNNANIEKQRMPLLDVFIGQFLESVNRLVKRGLRSDYVKCEDNLFFLKGKLNSGKQLRHNFINRHKFYCEYDEFLQDRPANRLIHTALEVVSKLARSSRNEKLSRELLFVFQDIPKSADPSADFSRLKIDRGMDYYREPLDWTKLILKGLSPQSMYGSSDAISLLFPMEAVFESFVSITLERQRLSCFQLRTQSKQTHFVMHGESQWFQLKPDLIVQKSEQNIAVLDTKWKLINQALGNGSDKYGLSQADFYQMFAYGHNYLNGSGNMFLIYPKQDNFEQAIQIPFDFTDLAGVPTDLKLWVVPFEIKEKGSRVLWPDALDVSTIGFEKRSHGRVK